VNTAHALSQCSSSHTTATATLSRRDKTFIAALPRPPLGTRRDGARVWRRPARPSARVVDARVSTPRTLRPGPRLAELQRFRHGGPETVELPTESPVVAVLREHALTHVVLVPRTRPIGCTESWVAYLARCVRQHCFREAPSIAAGDRRQTLLVDANGRLLACGRGDAVGHGRKLTIHSDAIPVAAMAKVSVRSVAAGHEHSLALGWDGRVYSWGQNTSGQLGPATRSSGSRRCWWRDSRTCAALPRVELTATPRRTRGPSSAGGIRAVKVDAVVRSRLASHILSLAGDEKVYV
jgi:hypothetical protein